MLTNISFYNTLSNKVEKFVPLEKNKVKMYVCGVTPYDTSHLGHAFVFTVFDTLTRFLKYNNYNIRYVQNVTDIDDPLLEKAEQLKMSWEELADKWTDYLLNDFKFLNIDLPNHYVKATQELPKMIEIIQVLVEKKYAYVNNGNVYFSVENFPKYGALSKLDEDTMLKLSAERGNDIKDPKKKNPLDFLLWKKSLLNEPFWESPWSKGRPGWHIECTAMSMKYLGERIDIHGGGTDLIFPHHESEIAQAEAYSGNSPFVTTWMHCAMVSYQGEKMSKSLGNLVYVQDLAKRYSANDIRYYLLLHHYRNEWEFFEKDMQAASLNMKKIEKEMSLITKTAENNEYVATLGDDLNIPKALDLLLKGTEQKYKKDVFEVLGFKLNK
jgi:cysteinyl-tRNA synthetase